MLTDGLEWCGLLVMFLSDSHSDGTHSLQSIHCWDTDAATHFYKSVEETNSSTSFGTLLADLHVCVNCKCVCSDELRLNHTVNSYSTEPRLVLQTNMNLNVVMQASVKHMPSISLSWSKMRVETVLNSAARSGPETRRWVKSLRGEKHEKPRLLQERELQSYVQRETSTCFCFNNSEL